MPNVTQELVSAIEGSGQTRYAISKGSGINQSVLSRLVNGQPSVSLEVAERLADYLGLEMVIRPKRRARKAK